MRSSLTGVGRAEGRPCAARPSRAETRMRSSGQPGRRDRMRGFATARPPTAAARKATVRFHPPSHESDRLLTGRHTSALEWVACRKSGSRPVYRQLGLGAPGPLRRVAQPQPSEGTRDGPGIDLLPERRDVELRAKKRRSRTHAGGILGLVRVARLRIGRVRGESVQRHYWQVKVGRLLRIPRD
jgi:hypothetical protein